jgi:putative membrane protein
MIVMMFWYGNGGWAWWQAGLMWAGMIAFWGLLIWVVYTLFTRAGSQAGRPRQGEQQPGDARRILDERLARGEIDPEEYRLLSEVIEGGAGRSPAGTGTGSGR